MDTVCLKWVKDMFSEIRLYFLQLAQETVLKLMYDDIIVIVEIHTKDVGSVCASWEQYYHFTTFKLLYDTQCKIKELQLTREKIKY